MTKSIIFKHAVSLVLMGFLIITAIGTTDTEDSTSDSVDLNANVRFTGTQFVIENKDSFDWTNVTLEVNGSTFSSGYKLKVSRLEAGETYTVGAMQFAKSDGEKFNPITYKVQSIYISCDVPNGTGWYSGSWN
jgi:hypothetical protein